MRNIQNHDVKIFTDNIETTAIEQIERLLTIPAFGGCKIRIMPDVHAGAGCVIGFTGDLGDKVIPNIVGVDIGCGILVQPFVCTGNIDYHALNASLFFTTYRRAAIIGTTDMHRSHTYTWMYIAKPRTSSSSCAATEN